MALTKEAQKELRSIAHDLKKHIERGCPYSLTFFWPSNYTNEPGSSNPDAPKLTDKEKKALEQYLEYHFKNIWGRTWIYLEANRLLKFVKNHS